MSGEKEGDVSSSAISFPQFRGSLFRQPSVHPYSPNNLLWSAPSRFDRSDGLFLKRSALDYFQYALAETLFPKKNQEERNQLFQSWIKLVQEFSGFSVFCNPAPSNIDILRIAIYLFGGFLFIPIINIITLLTEGLLKILAEMILYLQECTCFQYCAPVIDVFFNIFEGLRLLTRTYTSPINSFWASYKQGWMFGLLSATLTVIFYFVLTVASTPSLAVTAPAGLLTMLAHTPLAHLGSGVLWTLAQCGTTITPALVGASIISTLETLTILLFTTIFGISEAFPSKEPAKDSLPAPSFCSS